MNAHNCKSRCKHGRRPIWLLGLVATLLYLGVAHQVAAQCLVVSGSTGANGAFAPTSNATVQLPPDGILNYTTVNIPPGVTVKFQRNAANTPVYMLATGDVTIAAGATIDVRGGNANGPVLGSGGPGGFDGGASGVDCAGAGLGPGGGGPGCGGAGYNGGAGGSFKSPGGSGCHGSTVGPTYGNDRLLPLIGGSGGGGSNGGSRFGFGGGGGGGAILIATSATLNLSGAVLANGGSANAAPNSSGAGAGGGIRLIATALTGAGSISVGGGDGGFCVSNGGSGRVRLEFCQNTFSGSFPNDTSIASASPIFIASLPALAIAFVEGAAVGANPLGSFSLPPDLTFGAGTTAVTVSLAASGIPLGTTVTVKVTPESGLSSTVTSTQLSGSVQSSTATAEVTLATGKSIITAEATVAIPQGGGAALAAAKTAGETFERLRVSATYGGASSITLITASGREIPLPTDGDVPHL